MKTLTTMLVAALNLVTWNSAQGEKAVEGNNVKRPTYTIERAVVTPALDGNWEGPAWKDVTPLDVGHFYRTDLSDHRPRVQAKAVYDEEGLYIHFRVEDRYVRTVETKYHGKVWEDACVEFFVQPRPERGYFNFEINSGGTMLLSYEENPLWKGKSLRKDGAVPWRMAKKVKIYHSLPKTVDPERAEPVTWDVEYHIPFAILEAFLGELGKPAGQTWNANFYKCAENNSHPHWASWSKIEGELNFHKPEYFAPVIFAE